MKTSWLVGSAAAVVILAGQAFAAEAPAAAAPATAAPATAALDTEAGSALAKKSGCFACHSIETKRVGPSWNDVAAKYKGNAEAKTILVEWIKKGGTGRWPDPKTGKEMGVMPPYSPRVADADIDSLAGFIISLAK